MSRPWWHGAVTYQIYPRSFADSDGDGVGDLPGVTAHLDYVASLGVDAIWLSPFFTSPMRDFGYDVADYCGVDPLFGTLGDFAALVSKAHALGLRVLIDQIYSHTSDQHPWFTQSRQDRTNARADWYVWADPKEDGSPPSNWQSVFGGPAWQWDARRGQYYLHNFLSEQPDLNLHNPAVQEALLGVARFWLEQGVDGFRLDAINFAMHDPQLRDNPPAPANGRPRTRPVDFQQALYSREHPEIPRFLQRIRSLLDQYGGRFAVAEVGGEGAEPVMRRYTSGERHLHTSYGFNFLYADSLTPQLVRKALGAWTMEAAGQDGWPSWAFSNHDAPRAVSRWAREQDTAAMARLSLLLLLSLRGNLFLYQGEELGLPQAPLAFEQLRDPEAIRNWPLTLGRDGARTPMPWRSGAPAGGFSSGDPWLPVPDVHRGLAVDAQEIDPASVLALTRRLLTLRRRHSALRLGSLELLGPEDADLLVFERRFGDERLLCAFNLGAKQREWTLPGGGAAWEVLESVNAAGFGSLPVHSGLVAGRVA